MAITDIIIVAAIFIMGAAAGLVAVVSIGVRHEELLFREERRYREAQGNWPGPDRPSQFFSAEPPSLVCHGARALTGLWIRRERGADPLAIPWYERRRSIRRPGRLRCLGSPGGPGSRPRAAPFRGVVRRGPGRPKNSALLFQGGHVPRLTAEATP